MPSSSVAVITELRASFLWIPVTLVITADGCNDWGAENDGGESLLLLAAYGGTNGVPGVQWGSSP